MVVASIIILNWNGLAYLPGCLESLKNQTYQDFECIIVDNGSTDGSVEYLRNEHDWTRLICLEENVGFAAGNNTGFAESCGEYIVTLNNDTVLDRDWLKEMVTVADKNVKVGMIASRICSFYDRDVIDSLGVKICLDGMSRGAYRGRRYSEIQPVPEKILLPSACAALYKRSMIDQTGFFDSSYFAYCEDTDLGLRGRLAGWDACLASEAIVYHKYSATAGSFSPFKLYLVERNHFWTVFKNFPPILIVLLPLTTLFRFMVQAMSVLRSKGAGGSFVSSSERRKCVDAVFKGALHGILPFAKFMIRRLIDQDPYVSGFTFIRLLKSHKMSFLELLDIK